MTNFLKEMLSNNPDLYQRIMERGDKPFVFFPLMSYDKVNDMLEIRLKQDAEVVHPVPSKNTVSYDFDLLCDFDGNVQGFRINKFSKFKLMSQELLDALETYNMDRLWPKI